MGFLRLRIILLLQIAVMMFGAFAYAETETYSESNIKAAFVYNFFKFIELPQAALGDVHLCVIVPEEYREAFRGVDDKALDRGRLKIREFNVISEDVELSGCHAVFMSVLDNRKALRIIERAVQMHLLSIGQDPNFLAAGGIINFYVDQGKIRFEINLELAEKLGMKISSKLLKLGRVVNIKK